MSGSAGAHYLAAIERVNADDLDGYLDFYADDVVFGGVTPEPMDKAGVVAFHHDFYRAFENRGVDVVDLIEAGDRLAARLDLHLVHREAFMGVPATGAEVLFTITTLLHVRDGKCVERWSTADFYGLMAQIGAVPA
jgi:steroid delta-isomerase-like uncharacterized protein